MKNHDMTRGDPMRMIFAFAAPLLLGNIFQQLYNVIDSTIVGRFIGAQALAATGAPGSVLMLMMCLCMGLTSGAGIIIAQCYGAKNYDALRSTIGTLITVLSVLTGILMFIGTVIATPVLRFINVPENILCDASTYMKIFMLAAPFTMLYNACSALMRSTGDSRTPLMVLIISSFLNIGLDLLFITVFGWGVAGAALATGLAQAVSAVVCLMALYRKRHELHIDSIKAEFIPDSAVLIFKTGVPAAMQSSMISLGTLAVRSLINSFGTSAMAAYTAATHIDSLAIMVVVSMGMALSVYSGQNIGAGQILRIRQTLNKTLAVVLGYCAVIGLIIFFFGQNIISVFLDPNEAAESVAIGAQYLKIIGSAYVMAGIMRCYLNVIQGAGDTNISMLTGAVELSIRVIASYALVKPFGLIGLWIAIPISWGCGSIVPLLR
ncbi:MAG: MATE family efflux transporter, partial [Clostridia bacterium]|nr:MATE family efflux transporter [Clostridia bacterium]